MSQQIHLLCSVELLIGEPFEMIDSLLSGLWTSQVMNEDESRIFKVSVVLKLRRAQAAVGLAKKLRAAQSVPSQEQNSVQNDYVKICK